MRAALGSLEDREYKQLGREDIPFEPEGDLLFYLKGEFASGEPLRLVTHRSTGAGMALSDRMVSRLEVQSAIRNLPHYLRRTMETLYVDSFTPEEAARRLGVCRSTLFSYRNEAVKIMVRSIYD